MSQEQSNATSIVSTAEAAEFLGISERSLLLMGAAGMPGGERYQPIAESLAAVGAAFGVSERTAATWRANGMPGEPGRYPLATIAQWLRDQPNGEPWHETGNRNLQPRQASGDLARAIYRLLRVQVDDARRAALTDFMQAVFHELPDDGRKVVEFGFDCAINKHFGPFQLTDAEIEKTLHECWTIV